MRDVEDYLHDNTFCLLSKIINTKMGNSSTAKGIPVKPRLQRRQVVSVLNLISQTFSYETHKQMVET